MVRFLNVNGYDITATRKEIVEFALSIDVKNLNLEEIASWLKKQAKKIKN